MNESDTPPLISLRPALPDDEEFLFAVYASTRADELAQVTWEEVYRVMFLRTQFNVQQRIYGEDQQSIILADGKPAGRLIVIRGEEELRLADIALLPEYRGLGAATSLIKDLIAEAVREKKPLRLQVEIPNVQARRLYERLGFRTTGESGTHFQMEYVPA